MGVRGLQSFLLINRSHLGEEIHFKNSHLVIDANNLMCELYTRTCFNTSSQSYRNYVYGGNLVEYEQTVRKFFANLEKCSIEPILVFDGPSGGKAASKEFNAPKEEASYQRGRDNYGRAKLATEYPVKRDLFLPQTLVIVFRDVITELGIERFQAPYEADSHIARLANEKNCPVLSTDSDFIIYALDEGFLLWNLFSYESPLSDESGEYGISGCLFNQKQLARALPGLKSSTLPLMSTLLGNDYNIDSTTFDQVVRQICKKQLCGRLQGYSDYHERILHLLEWLQGKSLEDAKADLLGPVSATQRTKVESRLDELMRNYNIEDCDNLDSELEAVYDPKLAKTDKKELQPANYLRRLFEHDELFTLCLDMIFHTTQYGYSIVDDFSLPSSGNLRDRPNSLALTLLRPKAYSSMSDEERDKTIELDSLVVCGRLESGYGKIVIRSMETLDEFGSLDHIDCYSMILLDVETKKDLIMGCFYFNRDIYDKIKTTLETIYKGDYLEEACYCMLMIRYINIEVETGKPDASFIDALLLDLFYYANEAESLNETTFPKQEVYQDLLDSLACCTKVRMKSVSKSGDQATFRRLVHYISQLQNAYKGYWLLNSLLDSPLHRIRLGIETMAELCKDVPDLVDTCFKIRALVKC